MIWSFCCFLLINIFLTISSKPFLILLLKYSFFWSYLCIKNIYRFFFCIVKKLLPLIVVKLHDVWHKEGFNVAKFINFSAFIMPCFWTQTDLYTYLHLLLVLTTLCFTFFSVICHLFCNWAQCRFFTIRKIYIAYWTPVSFLTYFWNCHIHAHKSYIS